MEKELSTEEIKELLVSIHEIKVNGKVVYKKATNVKAG